MPIELTKQEIKIASEIYNDDVAREKAYEITGYSKTDPYFYVLANLYYIEGGLEGFRNQYVS